jgi:hypothetical protein
MTADFASGHLNARICGCFGAQRKYFRNMRLLCDFIDLMPNVPFDSFSLIEI